MRKDFSHLDQYRIKDKPFGTKKGVRYGAFKIPFVGRLLRVICASDDTTWQHVSVSLTNRCPNWDEMSHIKELFFDDEDTVVQFHPKKSEYKNLHPYCLHLWMHKDGHKLPPSILVAP